MNFRTVAIAAAAVCAATSQAFTNFYAFGDSLSDTGNVKILTFGAYPPAPYWNGRFSNGPVWAEHLATGLGFSANPSLAGGTNYAFGGAEANTGSTLSTGGTPNLGTQLGMFSSNVGAFGSNDLVSLWIGGNDFLNGSTNPTQVAGYVRTHLETVHALGGRHILVPNLPWLGYTPGYVGTALEGPANALTQAFNAALASQVSGFTSAHGDTTVYSLDVATLFNTVRSNPAGYGLTDVTHSYLATGGDPDRFLFWDDVHPTRQIHAIVGQQALAAVPEPATMALALLALPALLNRRRKRAA